MKIVKSMVNLKSYYYPKFSKNPKEAVLGFVRDNVGIENLKEI
ncbi:hypothetical protein ACY2C8_00650 [Mammaliicoccus sciuri]